MEIIVRFDDVTKHIEVEMPSEAQDNFVIACATALCVQACKMAEDEDKAMIRAAGLFDVVTSLIRNGSIEPKKEDKKQNFRAKGKENKKTEDKKPENKKAEDKKPKKPDFNADATSQMEHKQPKDKKPIENPAEPVEDPIEDPIENPIEEDPVELLADYPDSADEDPFADFY